MSDKYQQLYCDLIPTTIESYENIKAELPKIIEFLGIHVKEDMEACLRNPHKFDEYWKEKYGEK